MRWAEIVNGKVNRITISDTEEYGAEWLAEVFGTEWVIAPDDTTVGEGFIYNAEAQRFYPPRPYDSWTLNEETWEWEAPVPMPTDEPFYIWDEANQVWLVDPVNPPLPAYPNDGNDYVWDTSIADWVAVDAE